MWGTRKAHLYVGHMSNGVFYLFYTIFIFQHESLNLLFYLYSSNSILITA